MKAIRIAAGLILALVTASQVSSAATADESDAWSLPTNGLEARLTLVERPIVEGRGAHCAEEGSIRFLARQCRAR